MSDATRRVGLLLGRIAEHNKAVGARVAAWNARMAAENPNPRTRVVKLQRVDRWLRWAGYPPLKDAVKRLQDFFAYLAEESTLNERREAQIAIRQFLGVERGNKRAPAILFAKLKGKNGSLTRNDLLTEAEVQALIDACDHPRDRAFIATLWDTGARVDEVCSIKAADVRPTQYGAYDVTLSRSKTFERNVACFEAAPYLRTWLNMLGKTGDGASLWTSRRRGEDGIDVEGARYILRAAVAKARESGKLAARKRVYPHLFRHSRATRLVEMDYHETKLTARLGWALSSRQIARYVHLAAMGDIDEEARIHGIKAKPREPLGLRKVACPHCEAPNSPSDRFCSACGSVLDAKEREVLVAQRGRVLKDLLESDQVSPATKDMVMKLLLSGEADQIRVSEIRRGEGEAHEGERGDSNG